MKRFLLVVLTLFALSTSIAAQQSPPPTAIAQLWHDIRILDEPLVETYNQLARPNDLARIESAEDLNLLKGVTVGRRLLVFKSAQEAAYLMPYIAQTELVDVIGYNLESGPANPVAEQLQPVEAAQEMRRLADEFGLQLAFGPDHDFAVNYGEAIAPYVDIFVLQVQLAQNQPDKVLDFVMPLIPRLRAANPNLEISVQIRTDTDSDDLVALLDSLRDTEGNLIIDGVSILTRRGGEYDAANLIQTLQQTQLAQVPTPTVSITTPTPTVAPQTATPTSAVSMIDTLTANPVPLAMACALLTGSLVGGGVVFYFCKHHKS